MMETDQKIRESVHQPQLCDLVSVDLLQTIQDHFSRAVGIAMIIVDSAGVPITRPSNFCLFCQRIRNSEAYRDLCFQCDDEGARRALTSGRPAIYHCHCGLVDFAAPITLQGRYLGGFIAGQVQIRDDVNAAIAHLQKPSDFKVGDEHLLALKAKARVVPYAKLQAAANTLWHLANYLVEERYSAAVQQELGDQNLRLMEESKQRVELEKALRESQLQALVYQINPHFLFNVLNTIARLALDEGAPRTEGLVYAFADMMRYVLTTAKSQISRMGTEMQHVRNYVAIQQIRLGERLVVEIDVADRFSEVSCPFMTFQPIIENCINYAIEPKSGGGRVQIRAREEDGDLAIEIRDNGDGMSPDLVRACLDGTAEQRERTGIGLRNVDSRLRYYFGPEYGLRIESPNRRGEGTAVEIRLPLRSTPEDEASA